MHLFPQRNYQILRSLSLSRMPLVFYQQAADELGSNRLGGTGEEGLGEVRGGRGGYGSGFCEEVLRVADTSCGWCQAGGIHAF